MISEEIALNQAMERAGLDVVETDLGEYIIQLRKEPPSHIIAPAVHLTKEQVEADFSHHIRELTPERALGEPLHLVTAPRQMPRPRFLVPPGANTASTSPAESTGHLPLAPNPATRMLPTT